MALSRSMDKVGPICRSVEDCDLVLNAIHGADGVDPTARTVPFNCAAEKPPVEYIQAHRFRTMVMGATERVLTSETSTPLWRMTEELSPPGSGSNRSDTPPSGQR